MGTQTPLCSIRLSNHKPKQNIWESSERSYRKNNWKIEPRADPREEAKFRGNKE